MFSTLLNVFKIPELRNKILFTLGMLGIYRIGFYVPVPGVDQSAMLAGMGGGGGGGFGDLMEHFQLFTGGNLRQSTIFGLGIMPYITASIIFQILVTVVPSLEKLSQEGDSGRRKISEYTRYATVLICVVNAIVWMKYLAASDFIFPHYIGSWFGLSFSYWLFSVLILTTGTVFLMWLGEQIDEYGIGSGISLIIMAGIVVRMPKAVLQVYTSFHLRGSGSGDMDLTKVLMLCVMFVAVVAGSILITQGQRRIPIQQAKQTRGRRVVGGQRHYLPLRVNHGGVMPIIFASSMLIFPSMLLGVAANWWPNGFWIFLRNAFQSGQFFYILFYIVAIYFFAYFWTTVQFRPKEMANNLRDYGSFIPGLRPGKRTADYLDRVMGRITYVGAAFLAIIAIIPMLVSSSMKIPFSVSAFLGGTGLLIVVSVTLDLVQRIEANLIMRNYKGFLGNEGPIKGARM